MELGWRIGVEFRIGLELGVEAAGSGVWVGLVTGVLAEISGSGLGNSHLPVVKYYYYT